MYKLFIDTPHLIFQIHDTQADGSLDFPGPDILVLRGLAERYVEIAVLPAQEERKRMWRRLNDLEPERPLIWLNEVCWNEMDYDGSLRLRCSNEVCQRIETELRRTIFQWEHFPGDMIVEPIFYSPAIIQNTGFGISPVADVAVTDETSEIASRHFHNQIHVEEDLEKIRAPQISYNARRTSEFLAAYRRVFEGILPVQKRGSPGFWFAPWDLLEAQSGAPGHSELASGAGSIRTGDQAGCSQRLQCRNRPEQHQHRSTTTAAALAVDGGGYRGGLAPRLEVTSFSSLLPCLLATIVSGC